MEGRNTKTAAEKERERINEAVRSIMVAVMRGQGEPHRTGSVQRTSPLKSGNKETSAECTTPKCPIEQPSPSQSTPDDFLSELLDKRSTLRKSPELGSTSADWKVDDLQKEDTLWSELKIAVEKRRRIIEGEIEAEDSTNDLEEDDVDETNQ